MKIKSIFTLLLSALLCIGCSEEQVLGNYTDLNLSSSYISISEEGETVEAPKAPSREGNEFVSYEFSGWFTAGAETAYDYLLDFGFTTIDERDKAATTALGGLTQGVSVLEETAAYASIANGGTYYEPIYYTVVYDHDGNLVFDTDSQYDYLKDDINECENTEWYKILIYPKNNNGLDKTVDFGIVYWQNWSSSHINLYINGEYDNIRWPNSGTNPKLISIRHINQPINN